MLKINNKKGFTLVELMVSISIFSIVMFISIGSILSVIDANKKSQSLRAVMDNLNFTIEAMTRTMRFGTNYHCDVTVGDTTQPRDCVSGANSISVKSSSGSFVVYKLINSRIVRNIGGAADYFLTSPDVTITNMTFRVFGSTSFSNGDLYQPEIILVISGYAGTKATSRSSFTIETTVTQRLFDSQ